MNEKILTVHWLNYGPNLSNSNKDHQVLVKIYKPTFLRINSWNTFNSWGTHWSISINFNLGFFWVVEGGTLHQTTLTRHQDGISRRYLNADTPLCLPIWDLWYYPRKTPNRAASLRYILGPIRGPPVLIWGLIHLPLLSMRIPRSRMDNIVQKIPKLKFCH